MKTADDDRDPANAGWESANDAPRPRTSFEPDLPNALARLVAQGFAYYCYCSAEGLRVERENAEQRSEAWEYDRACLALARGKIAELAATGAPRAIRFKVGGSTVR